MDLYGERLFSRLPEVARAGMVGRLCRPPEGSNAALAAHLINSWVKVLQPSRKTVADLTSADDDAFWSGFWELTCARAFAVMGFGVDMRASVEGTTPDLLVHREDLTAMVEVVSIQSDQDARDEQGRLDRIAARVQASARLPATGFLSLSANADVDADPPDVAIDSLAVAIEAWLDNGGHGPADFNHTPIPCSASWWPSDDPLYVTMSAAVKFLGETPRIRERIADKITKYAPYVTDTRRLIVTVAQRGWTVTRSQIVTAMFGNERVAFTGDRNDARFIFDGKGAAVAGGPASSPGADRLSGVFTAESLLYDQQRRALLLNGAFVYSPYCSDGLPADTFAPLPEMQVIGPHLVWVRDDPPQLLVLD